MPMILDGKTQWEFLLMKFDIENMWKVGDEFHFLPSLSVVISGGKYFFYAIEFSFLTHRFMISKSHAD